MNDLVERARLPGAGTHKFQQELADEIERLRADNKRLRAVITRAKDALLDGQTTGKP